MKQNKDTIASLKREYKELMAQLSEQNIGLGKTKENEVRLRTRHSRSTASSPRAIIQPTAPRVFRRLTEPPSHVPPILPQSTAGSEELYRLQQFSKELKKKYDNLKQQAVRKTRELEHRLDSIKDLEHDSVKPQDQDNDTTRLIRQLENRFDKALIKYNEAQSIHRTYEQIVKRLMDERVGFDQQLGSLERTLKQKEKDLAELTLMSHDANAAKDKAKGELMEVDTTLAKDRAKRDKELRARRNMVRAREDMNREEERLRLARDAEEERRAEAARKKAEAARTKSASELAKKKAMEQGRISSYEEAFLKIKEATGVSDLNQVIQKFMTQEDTNRNLKQLTKDGQLRIEALKDEIRACKDKLESLQFGGPTGPASRRMVDEREMQLSTGVVNNDRAKLRFETVNKLLVAMKAGTEHLVDSLDGITSQAPPPPMSDETVVEVLATCEQKLLRALEYIGKEGGEASLSQTIRENGSPDVSANNFRLELSMDGDGSDDEDEEGEDEDAAEEAVPDRDFVKNNAELMSERAGGKKKGRFGSNAPSTPTRGAREAPPTPSTVRGKAGRGTRPGLA